MQAVRRSARRWAAVLAALAVPCALAAQKRPPLEFTQQGVLIGNFWVVGKTTPSATRSDLKAGRKAGDAVRDRLSGLVNKRETKVISAYDMEMTLSLAGYALDTTFSLAEMHQQGKYFRTDEIITGTLTGLPKSVRMDATITLYRDLRMRQPIAAVTAPDADKAARTMAAKIEEARSQLKYQRRCENSLREGKGQDAVRHAREGVAQYGRGALVRTCLLWAMYATGAPATDVLDESLRVLEIDSGAAHAMEYAAMALDTLKRRAEAADMWLRLAATDSTNIDLIERVAFTLADHGNSRPAEPFIVKMSGRYPENLRLVRQKWRISNDTRNWPLAVSTGERLMSLDPDAAKDSVFYLRLSTAYRMNGQPFKSVETVAKGVAAFPGDARLYALYTQFVREEADTAIGRGLALYPGSAELAALSAKDLRAKGKTAEALEASKRAVALDSSIAQGRILVAQGEFELGRPDSALVALQRAIAAGEDVSAVAAFALSKGNVLFRAANGTKTRADFQLAMRFLWFADSLKPTPQTKFLLGAAALNVAQTALTDAPKITLREEACSVAHLGADAIPVARSSLDAGKDVSPDATKQFLDYLDVIAPYAEKQLAAFCAATPPSATTSTPPPR
jgi:tetratricopeptide (TPR) repeat protein